MSKKKSKKSVVAVGGLSVEERRVLRSDTCPELVRGFVAQHQDSLGVRTTAFKKIAAAADAEYAALMSVARLRVIREHAAQASLGQVPGD